MNKTGSSGDPAVFSTTFVDCIFLSGSITNAGTVDPFINDSDPWFDFGNLINADDDADAEFIVVEFNALVLNVSANQAGVTHSNDFTVHEGGELVGNATNLSITLVEPRLEITKTFSSETATINETVGVTLVVRNAGTSTAHDVIIEDLFPTSTIQAVSEGITPPDFTFFSELSGGNRVIRFSGGPIEVGGERTFTFSVTTGASFPSGSTYVNTATITQATTLEGESEFERDLPDVDAQDTLTSISPDLVLTKGDGIFSLEPGQITIYTITIENVGLHEAINITVSDEVPAGTTFSAAGSTSGWSCADGDTAGTVCTFEIDSLASGAVTSLDFALKVNDPVGAEIIQIENIASVTDDGTFGEDPTPENNSDNDVDNLQGAEPRLEVDKTDTLIIDANDSGNASAGDTLRYTITITNNGNQAAGNVIFTDTPPAHTSLVVGSVTTTQGNITIGNDEGHSSVRVEIGDLVGAGGSATVTFDVRINDPLPSGVTFVENQGFVNGDNFPEEPSDDPDNPDEDDPTLTLLDTAFIKVLTETNQNFTENLDVAIGEIVTYQVSLYVPPGQTRQVLLSDTLPRGLALVDCLSIASSSDELVSDRPDGLAGACESFFVREEPEDSPNEADPGRYFEFDLGNLINTSDSVEIITITYRVVVLNSLENQNGTSLNNSVVWSFQGGSLSAAAQPVRVVEPDLQVVKSANNTIVSNGDVITFTLTVSHTAFSRADAHNIELLDYLPEELEYVAGSFTQISGAPAMLDDSDPLNLRATWEEFPLNAEAAVLQFRALVTDLSPLYDVRNTATLTWTSLPGDVSDNLSIYNDLSNERSFEPGSELDNFGDDDEVIIQAPPPAPRPTPILVPTSVPATTPRPQPTLPATK